MMTRLFYIVPVVVWLVSCSGNVLLYDTARLSGDTLPRSFIMEQNMREASTLHYPQKVDSTGNLKEYSFSFIRHYKDSVVWEEGVIRLP